MDKAYKLLLDQEQKKRALDVIQAGKEYVEHTVSIYSAAVCILAWQGDVPASLGHLAGWGLFT